MDMSEKSFSEQVFAIVKRIPRGKVTTYGHIAALMGHPRGARVVGYVLRYSTPEMPVHRVVNRKGELCPDDIFGGKEVQRQILESEGITFLAAGTIDLDAHLWLGE